MDSFSTARWFIRFRKLSSFEIRLQLKSKSKNVEHQHSKLNRIRIFLFGFGMYSMPDKSVKIISKINTSYKNEVKNKNLNSKNLTQH